MTTAEYIANLISQADEILVMAQGQARLQHEWVAVTTLGSARDMAQLARRALLTPRPDANAILFPAPSTTKLATSETASSDGASGNAAQDSEGGAGTIPRSTQEQPPTTPEHPAAHSEGASQLPRAGADGGAGSFMETL